MPLHFGTCPLCLAEDVELRKSHIIPKFCFKNIKNKKNSFVAFDAETQHASNLFDAAYERLLCSNCEELLSRNYEMQGHKLLFARKTNSQVDIITNKNSVRFMRFDATSGYDYSKFKLFVLSILWRASVAKRPFFKDFTLSKTIEEELRKMIIEGIAEEEDIYPCLIRTPYFQTENEKIIMDPIDLLYMRMPYVSIIKGIRHCEFILSGISFLIRLEKHPTIQFLNSIQKSELNLIINSIEMQQKMRKQLCDSYKKNTV